MKELELEIGVTYQPRSYESVRATLRVALQEGENSEEIAQVLAEKVARIASNNEPDNYQDCMKLLGRSVSIQQLENMQAEWHQLKIKTKELEEKILAQANYLEELKEADNSRERLFQLLEAANCWTKFQNTIYNIVTARTFPRELISEELPHLPLPRVETSDDIQGEDFIPM